MEYVRSFLQVFFLYIGVVFVSEGQANDAYFLKGIGCVLLMLFTVVQDWKIK